VIPRDFEFKPHEDLEAYVRTQLLGMRERPKMYANTRGMYVERVATLIECAGVAGPSLVHLANKQGNAVIKLGDELTDEWAHKTIDEAVAVLDGVKEHGKVERPVFRYERP